MMDDVFARVRDRPPTGRSQFGPVGPRDHQQIARTISALEREDEADAACATRCARPWRAVARPAPVIGITGTGGAGKSSLTDELLMRFVRFHPGRNIAVVAMDPTRRRSGGALLGDRIRMNSLANEQIFMRSLATRRQNLATSAVLADTLNLLKCAAFDLIVIETAGIGQSDSEIVDLVDVPMYVMTSEYGAASQLEKIDMLDFAELIALNKFEKRGAEDALRDVRKQWRRNRGHDRARRPGPGVPDDREPFQRPGRQPVVRGALRAARFEDRRASALDVGGSGPDANSSSVMRWCPRSVRAISPRSSGNGRRAREDVQHRAAGCEPCPESARGTADARDPLLPAPLERYPAATLAETTTDAAVIRLRDAYNDALDAVGIEGVTLLRQWPAQAKSATDEQYVYIGARQGDSRRQLHRDAESQPGTQAGGSALRRLGRATDVPAQGEPARAVSRTPQASIRIAARKRIRRACSPARADPSAPIGAFTTSPVDTVRRVFRPHSTRPRCTVRIRIRDRTSTVASATPVSRSRRSTT